VLIPQTDEHCLLWRSLDDSSLAGLKHAPVPPLRHLLTKPDLTKLSQENLLVKTLVQDTDQLLTVILPYWIEPTRPLYLGVYHSLAYLQTAGRMVRLYLLGVLAFLIASMVLCVWWISKQVTNPLLHLSQVARRLAHLDFFAAHHRAGRN